MRAFGTGTELNRGVQQTIRQSAMFATMKSARFYDFWLADLYGRSAAKKYEPVSVGYDDKAQVNVNVVEQPLVHDAFQDDLVRIVVTKDAGTRVSWTNTVTMYSKAKKDDKDYSKKIGDPIISQWFL